MGDVVARYWMLRGFDVMHPIGWDGTGLRKNAAIAQPHGNVDYANMRTRAKSFARYGLSFDWTHQPAPRPGTTAGPGGCSSGSRRGWPARTR